MSPLFFLSYETFVPTYCRSLELPLHGTFVPWSENDVELSFPGTFDPMPSCQFSDTRGNNFKLVISHHCRYDILLKILFHSKLLRGHVHGMMSCDPCSPCVQLVATTIYGQGEQKFHIIFALESESSREGKFQLWNFRFWERKYVWTKVPVTVVPA